MVANKKIHFEISERKILLRVFDVLSVLFALYVVAIILIFRPQIITGRLFWGFI